MFNIGLGAALNGINLGAELWYKPPLTNNKIIWLGKEVKCLVDMK